MKQWGINLPMVDEFLQQTGQASTRSAQTYATSLKQFDEFCKESETEPLTMDSIVGFRDWLVENKAESTAGSYATFLNIYLNFLAAKRYDTDLDFYRVNKVLKGNGTKRAWENVVRLDEARFRDIPLLIEYFQDFPIPKENDRYNRRLSALRDRAIFWTIYDTWARVNEIRNLNRNHLTVDGYVVIEGKGRKPHTLIFDGQSPKFISAYLRERKDNQKPMFVAHSLNARNQRLSVTSIHNIIKRYVIMLGLEDELSCHDIRHYQATRALRNSVPLHVIQDKLNHQSIQTTRDIYAPVTGLDTIRKELSVMPYV